MEEIVENVGQHGWPTKKKFHLKSSKMPGNGLNARFSCFNNIYCFCYF